MRILLVDPHLGVQRNWLFGSFFQRSLALEQIAALTPLEHEVEIVDEKKQTIDFSKHYDLVGITCLTVNALRAYAVADRFRAQGTPVVLGGYHPSLMRNEAKAHADSVVIGEAELVWSELLHDLKRGALKPFYQADRPVDASEIPAARRLGMKRQMLASIQSSRGCPNQCRFCSMHWIETAHFRPRPVDHVIQELASIPGKRIFFVDASMTIEPSFSKAVFREMADLGKRFECYGNVDVLSKDDELLRLASEAGCIRWIVGMESISQEALDSVHKRTNIVKDYAKAIKKTKDHGMLVTGLFMFGFDTDSVDVFPSTLQAMEEWDLDSASFSILTPYPGTDIYREMDESGRILTKNWSLYTEGNIVFQPKQMTREELLHGTQQAAMEFYSYPNSLRRCISPKGYDLSIWIAKIERNFLYSRQFNKELHKVKH